MRNNSKEDSEMPEERIQLLLTKYLLGDLTPEESRELDELRQSSPVAASLFERLQDRGAIQNDLHFMAGIDPAKKRRSFRRTGLRNGLAAAAIIIASIFGIYWLYHPGPASQSIAVHASILDLQPGTEKATLKFGKQVIEVQDMGIGVTLQQKGATLYKKDSNNLTYTALPLGMREPGHTPDSAEYNTLTTARSGQFQLLLSDGTKVWLSNASSLSYPASFTGNYRETDLKGEAYFEVARIANKPFRVNFSDHYVDVMGTSFHVSAYPDEPNVRATLLNGSIAFGSRDQRHTLQPGQQVIVDTAEDRVPWRYVEDVDSSDILAWRQGFFYFKHTPYQEVLRQLSRWFGTAIRPTDKVKYQTYSGKIKRDQSLLTILSIMNLTARYEGTSLIVTRE